MEARPFQSAPDRDQLVLKVGPRDAAPALPTLIRPLPDKPLQFQTLAALARHIHRERGAGGDAEKGLEIGPLQFASHGGSDTFPGFNLHLLDAQDGGRAWLGWVAIQAETPDRLKTALRETEPQPRRSAA